MNNRQVCQNMDEHTECPEPVREWDEWASEKCKTHYLDMCWGCGLLVIWKDKSDDEEKL